MPPFFFSFASQICQELGYYIRGRRVKGGCSDANLGMSLRKLGAIPDLSKISILAADGIGGAKRKNPAQVFGGSNRLDPPPPGDLE